MTERWTAGQFRAFVAGRQGGKTAALKRMGNKYGAVRAFRCEACGLAVLVANASCPVCRGMKILSFDSKAEAARYDLLRSLQKLGMISDLQRQVPYDITMEGEDIAVYRLDFRYRDDKGALRHEDVKGGDATMTPTSKLKIKLVEAQHGIKVEIVR